VKLLATCPRYDYTSQSKNSEAPRAAVGSVVLREVGEAQDNRLFADPGDVAFRRTYIGSVWKICKRVIRG
jgi:hypothetical protein